MMNKKLATMSIEELKEWLKSNLGSKWSNRDLTILSEMLFDEYQSSEYQVKYQRTDREFFTKMLIKGKIQNGISLED